MPEPTLPRGFRDLMPNEALFRIKLIRKIESVFELYGFLVIDTPSLEKLSILNAKGGIGEEAKLIFEIKDDDTGMRYDNTVSLARYVSMHRDLPMPFKRYTVGKVWRREEPQRMRYREITQADIDIVGGDPLLADTEVIATLSSLFDALGLPHRIELNDRAMLEAMMAKIGIENGMFNKVEHELDRLEKIGNAKVVESLLGIGLPKLVVDQLMQIVGLDASNEALLDSVDSVIGNASHTKHIRNLIDLFKQYGSSGKIVVKLSMVRGLDYYTGVIFEFKDESEANEQLTLAGGGRYDRLIGLYGSQSVPAVGAAVGVDRLMDMFKATASPEYSGTRAFIACVKQANYPYALKIAQALRAKGVSVETNLTERNLSNQFAYASSTKVPYVIVVGDMEEKAGTLKLRNMIDGTEGMMSIDGAVRAIIGVLDSEK